VDCLLQEQTADGLFDADGDGMSNTTTASDAPGQPVNDNTRNYNTHGNSAHGNRAGSTGSRLFNHTASSAARVVKRGTGNTDIANITADNRC
jgi:hypothetical protein